LTAPNANPILGPNFPEMPTELSTAEIEKIRKTFKRSSEEVVQAILSYRQDGELSNVPMIARGIIVRYLRAEARESASNAPPETELSSFGVDSLTMLEIVLDLQEAFDITIEDSELKQLRTIQDVNDLLMAKARQRSESL
jgi:acyl carrier protein